MLNFVLIKYVHWQKFKKIDEESIPLVYQQSLLAATRCMGNKFSAF
jgi:hypothetical protein